MARSTKEHQAFRDLTDRLLTVSKVTLDKRIASEDAKRAEVPRSGRPRPSDVKHAGHNILDGGESPVSSRRILRPLHLGLSARL